MLTVINSIENEVKNNDMGTFHRFTKAAGAEKIYESEMNSLRQKQREWITYRDNKAEQDAAEYEGGTMAQLELILSKANTTQERCYELVNWYMK